MAYKDLINVVIDLQTSPISQQGFGIPMFISAHANFNERVRSYASVEDVAVDFDSTESAYIAAERAFSAIDRPALIMLGRRKVGSIVYTPEDVTAIGQVYSIAVVGTDDIEVVAEYTTTTGVEAAADVVTALVAGLSGVVGVTVTDNTGTFSLAATVPTDDFIVNSTVRLESAVTSTEIAADTLDAITEENDDFYLVAAEDHTESYVLAMAQAIESREKIYFVSSSEVENLGVYNDSATDLFSKLKDFAFLRTSAWYHHEADTVFPEMAYLCTAAASQAGTKIWANNKVTGVEVAKNVDTGNKLTKTEKGNLNDKKANYTEYQGGVIITRNGYVSGNEFIDIIRNRDFIKAKIVEAYQSLFINSPVIPYTDAGIGRIRSTLSSTMNRYVGIEERAGILDPNLPYIINFPRRVDIDVNDVANRHFVGSFTAYLSGAIQTAEINGTLTYNAN